jgi:hypothetical protein
VFSVYHAYECYERRVMRGEFAGRSASTHAPLAVRLGDLLIAAGLRLKRPYCPNNLLTRSSLHGSTS